MWQNWQIWGMFWYKETICCARQRKPWFLVHFILISNEENYFPPDLKWQKNLLVACSGFLSSKRPDLKWHACSILILSSGLHNLLHPCIRDARKWRENEKMKRKRRECEEVERKWRGNEEMERYSLFTFPHFLFISPLSIHFLYQNLSHFVAKC